MSYPPPRDWQEPRPYDAERVRYYDADPTPPHGVGRSPAHYVWTAFFTGLLSGAASASILWWAWRGLP